jgi:hypothetical protein
VDGGGWWRMVVGVEQVGVRMSARQEAAWAKRNLGPGGTWRDLEKAMGRC